MKANRVFVSVVIALCVAGCLLIPLIGCEESPTDPDDSLPTHQIFYGYFFKGWPAAAPTSAVSSVSPFTNTLVVDYDAETIRETLEELNRQDVKAVLDVQLRFQDLIPYQWPDELERADSVWNDHLDAIAAFLLVQRPTLTTHRISQNSWDEWDGESIRELVTLFHARYPDIPTLVSYIPAQETITQIPENLDWIGIEFFPFRTQNELSREEFLHGWTLNNGQEVLGLNTVVDQIRAKTGGTQSLILIGQSFGYEDYRFPPFESLQWYYDYMSEASFTGLLWMKAFDPVWQETITRMVCPFTADRQTGTLEENLPSVVQMQREIGARVVDPWDASP